MENKIKAIFNWLWASIIGVNSFLMCRDYKYYLFRAKGIWREELPYAKYMLDVIVRDSLTKLVAWYIGMNHNWRVNTGAAGRLARIIGLEIATHLEFTYPIEDDECVTKYLNMIHELPRDATYYLIH